MIKGDVNFYYQFKNKNHIPLLDLNFTGNNRNCAVLVVCLKSQVSFE